MAAQITAENASSDAGIFPEFLFKMELPRNI